MVNAVLRARPLELLRSLSSPTVGHALRPSFRRFALLLALVLLALLASKPDKSGDFVEYLGMTVAIGQHGTPDIRASDAELAMRLSPEAGYRDIFRTVRDNIARGDRMPVPGLFRATNGDVFAIHFFAYPALVALPFRLLQEMGGNPFKAFQLVNYAALWLLGAVLFQFFGSSRRAFAALWLVLLSGGVLYGNWCSPEMFTACALLSGMLLFTLDKPMRAGLFVGLAAMQNPPLIMFAVFAPLFGVLHERGVRHALAFPGWRAVAADRRLHGAALQFGLTLLPFAFGLWAWNTPSIIAMMSTDPRLVSLTRLFSYYFDLSQGMILAVPGIVLLLPAVFPRRQRAQALALMAVTLLFTLGLALPTLSTVNWNSGAHGIMRYVFWGAMPLLFLLLSYLRERARWPVALLWLTALLQAGAMQHARQYEYTSFSPLARAVLAHAPALYSPEPEVFFERATHLDGGMRVQGVAVYPEQGAPKKILFNANSENIDRLVCPPGQGLAESVPVLEQPGGWRYLKGPVRCVARVQPFTIRPQDYGKPEALVRLEGWSQLELAGGDWDGMWTDGPRSVMLLPAGGRQYGSLYVVGHYLKSVRGTQVIVNGLDLGRLNLDESRAIPLPPLRPGERGYTVEFRHAVTAPPPGPETRRLGFFMQEVRLR